MRVLAPELDQYQDEPRQLPTGGLGKDALLRLKFEARQDRFSVLLGSGIDRLAGPVA